MKFFIVLLFFLQTIYAVTIKDISNVVGIRDNQLIGYGLVVGLAGSGDKSQFTMQSLQNLLRNSYIKIPASSIKSKNIAAVMVTAELPPFARQGDKIKVKISAIGDAKSIDNGELLLTQLKAVDGQVYALAQGSIVAESANPTTGFIYEGATVENEVDYSLKNEDSIKLSLLKNDAKQAYLVEKKINEFFNKPLAVAIDTRTIYVKKPQNSSIVKFLSDIQSIQLDSTFKKKIIIDVARETIIAGLDIPIGPVTVAKKDFTIRIKKSNLSETQWEDNKVNKGQDIGDNVRLENKPVAVNINNTLMNTKEVPTVSDLVRAMKVMKLPITEIIDTLKMIKELGALDVELEIRG
ncbi:flagellar biosynthesis protein FlgI [Halarcobacter bivalviorum]|uniref:Flagellar P-ring protein n=1 Tax=Halarcobacter bivalviorum TaxID=663364 RepID=A0AAX2A708_9BACT|nr:flagellar peptidoglycan-localized P-ring protein FlgI [Halarcobacter bivalviorum]RXK04783.1 flagellar biosynthesis protein FlgI [Halarcobacter bivalviorum]RXK10039.1 flagellar biosynthesis protein FlgI [Halarcobacter bivalviorum]